MLFPHSYYSQGSQDLTEIYFPNQGSATEKVKTKKYSNGITSLK